MEHNHFEEADSHFPSIKFSGLSPCSAMLVWHYTLYHLFLSFDM